MRANVIPPVVIIDWSSILYAGDNQGNINYTINISNGNKLNVIKAFGNVSGLQQSYIIRADCNDDDGCTFPINFNIPYTVTIATIGVCNESAPSADTQFMIRAFGVYLISSNKFLYSCFNMLLAPLLMTFFIIVFCLVSA